MREQYIMVGVAGSIAKIISDSAFSLYQGNVDRSLLQVKLGLAEQNQKKLDAINDKYDGAKPRAIEEQINKIQDQKGSVARLASNVQVALNMLNDLRVKYLEAKDYANSGNSASFDVALETLNSTVGSTVNPDHLLGNSGNGTWGSKVYTAALNGRSVFVETAFLGTDYRIELADGATFSPDFHTRELGEISFDNLHLDSESGNQVTFTDTSTSTQYTGTLNTGGGNVKSAWLYNDFATDADKTNAKDAIDTALHKLNLIEQKYNGYYAQLQGIVSSVDTQSKALTAEYNKVATAENEARAAERSALQAKFDFAVHNLAITAAVSTGFIESMFHTVQPGEKQDLFTVINSE